VAWLQGVLLGCRALGSLGKDVLHQALSVCSHRLFGMLPTLHRSQLCVCGGGGLRVRGGRGLCVCECERVCVCVCVCRNPAAHARTREATSATALTIPSPVKCLSAGMSSPNRPIRAAS